MLALNSIPIDHIFKLKKQSTKQFRFSKLLCSLRRNVYMPKIYIRESETYRTRIEDVTDKDLFFYPVYKQAQDCLKKIVVDSQRYSNKERQVGTHITDSKEINPLRLKGYPNNIIAFCAKRGHGKTSAMISFSTALARMHVDDNPNPSSKNNFWDESIRNSRFLVLDSIDPTTLEQTDSIIRTVISRMFQHFSEKSFYGYRNQDKRGSQQKLLQLFQTCFRLADQQKDTERHNDDYDDLQRLTELGDSSNFKNELNMLISSYLAFMLDDEIASYKQSNASRFLVIQIDDADMNTTNAYEVVEDIRKYCVLPNVIILFATDMSLLEQTVEHYFVKSFDTIIYGGLDGDRVSKHTAQLSRERCHKTAISYLEKLIPGLHRINLPDIDAELRNSMRKVYLNIESDDMQHDQVLSELRTGDTNSQDIEYQRALIQLLQRKCLFSIPYNDTELHPFFPKRMRELSHFMIMLRSMDDVNCTMQQLLLWAAGGEDDNTCRDAAHALEANLELLLDYFLNRWCENRLDHRERSVIADIHNSKAENKVRVATESLMRTFSENKFFADRDPNGGWQELLNCTQHLIKSQKREFACALELYFHLFRDILMVYDCEEQADRRRANA